MTDLHISADQGFAAWLHYPAEFDSPHYIHLSQQLNPCVDLLSAGLVWNAGMHRTHSFLSGIISAWMALDCLLVIFNLPRFTFVLQWQIMTTSLNFAISHFPPLSFSFILLSMQNLQNYYSSNISSISLPLKAWSCLLKIGDCKWFHHRGHGIYP